EMRVRDTAIGAPNGAALFGVAARQMRQHQQQEVFEQVAERAREGRRLVVGRRFAIAKGDLAHGVFASVSCVGSMKNCSTSRTMVTPGTFAALFGYFSSEGLSSSYLMRRNIRRIDERRSQATMSPILPLVFTLGGSIRQPI